MNINTNISRPSKKIYNSVEPERQSKADPCGNIRDHFQDRPNEVIVARDSFTLNNYISLGVDSTEIVRGAELVNEALEDLKEPRVFVNRSLRSALGLLRKGGAFSTIFDKAKDPNLSQDERDEIEFYLLGREAREESLGTHGQGCLEGRTVYGSLGFSDFLSAELRGQAMMRAATTKSEATELHLNSGIALTAGAVTFVMKPEVNDRATFLPSDTYDTHQERPVSEEHLPFAIWANIGSKGDAYFDSPHGSKALLDLPEDQAVHGVKRFLTSDAINRGYMEAQIRGATLEDVERIVLRRDNADNGAQTDLPSFEKGLQEVKRLAAEHGIPCQEAEPAKKNS